MAAESTHGNSQWSCWQQVLWRFGFPRPGEVTGRKASSALNQCWCCWLHPYVIHSSHKTRRMLHQPPSSPLGARMNSWGPNSCMLPYHMAVGQYSTLGPWWTCEKWRESFMGRFIHHPFIFGMIHSHMPLNPPSISKPWELSAAQWLCYIGAMAASVVSQLGWADASPPQLALTKIGLHLPLIFSLNSLPSKSFKGVWSYLGLPLDSRLAIARVISQLF